jgi:outer membrane receptor protein involved in Fe transport
MEIIQNKSAYFGNITYPLPFYDRLRLTAGYRKSWDESYGIGVQGDPSTTGRTWEEGNNEKRSKPNWKFGFEYDAADNMMVYGNYASSYRSLNAVGRPVQGEWPPNENLKSYTMGLKSRWLDNRLQVNLNAYYYDYQNKYCVGFIETYATEEDLGPYDFLRPTEPSSGGPPPPPPGQASAQQPPGGPTGDYEEVPDGVYPSLDIYDSDGDGIYDEPLPIRVTDPSANGFGNFSSLGIDLSTTWIITSKDRLNLSIAYLDSQWEDLHFRYFYAPENTETDFPDVPDFRYNLWHWEDFSGVTPENAPKWGVTANYQHNFTLGALGNLTPRIDMKYKSEYSLSGQWNENKAPYIYAFQEAYTMWDASAAFQHSSGKWSLNAYVKNLTNYAVKTQARVYGNYARMRLGDPRTYGMTFSIKFF